MRETNLPTIGLALSGSGNRSTFYIGFLESFIEAGIKIDFLSACSGGSLVAAAYACGSLQEFKKLALSLDNVSIKNFVVKSSGKGGLYSLDKVEEELLKFTKGLTFDEVKPLMSFTAVDIETGEQVPLCMGDIAKAARISCTLPGVFEPITWGNRTLVDGGLLSLVPLHELKQFSPDIVIGVNMRGTKHIFSQRQLTMRKFLNYLKRFLFVEELETWIESLMSEDDVYDLNKKPGIFSVLGKSLDLAIAANKRDDQEDLNCDLLITPNLPLLKRDIFAQFNPYYEAGKRVGREHIPQIQKLIAAKSEQAQKTPALVK